jgi:hypothetical protein
MAITTKTTTTTTLTQQQQHQTMFFQFEVDLMASRLTGSPLATSEPLSENASSKSSGVFVGMHRWHQEDLARIGELEVSNR